MGVMVLVSGACCAGLLLLSGLLWVMAAQRRGQQVTARVEWKPTEQAAAPLRAGSQRVHPRMDLACGLVPERQAVDLDCRRIRQQLNGIPAASDVAVGMHAGALEVNRAAVTVGAAAFAPFAERRKMGKSSRQRLDLVYAREGMGDLSDPDVRPVRQVRIGRLDTAWSAD